MSDFLQGLTEDQKSIYEDLGEGEVQKILADKLAGIASEEREAAFPKLKNEAEIEAESEAEEEELNEDISDDKKEDVEELNETEEEILDEAETEVNEIELTDDKPDNEELTEVDKEEIPDDLSESQETESEELDEDEKEVLLDELEDTVPQDEEAEFAESKEDPEGIEENTAAAIIAEELAKLEEKGLTREQVDKIKEDLSPDEQKAIIAKLKATPADKLEGAFAELKADIQKEAGENLSKGALEKTFNTIKDDIDKAKDGILDTPFGNTVMTGLGVLGGVADFFSDKPHPNFCFNVNFIPWSIEWALLADPTGWNFQEVAGIESSNEIETIKEGGENRFSYRVPGRTSFDNLVVKRAMKTIGPTSTLSNWCMSSMERSLASRISTADIIVSLLGTSPAASLLTDASMPIAVWHFRNAYPVKWKIGDFNAQSGEILIEEVEFCYKYFTRKM